VALFHRVFSNAFNNKTKDREYEYVPLASKKPCDEVPDWHLLAQDPAQYGFLATLKAPFELHPSRTEADLISEIERAAVELVTVDLGALIVGKISNFIAFLPRQVPTRLFELADVLDRLLATFNGYVHCASVSLGCHIDAARQADDASSLIF
jgi:hypothetical protein